MQLKEFGLISSAIEAAEVFRAIETAIPIEVIDVTIGHTAAIEERKRFPAIVSGSMFGNCHESVVK